MTNPYLNFLKRAGDRWTLILAVVFAFLIGGWAKQPNKRPEDSVPGIVALIQRADYEGDRSALQRLYDELGPFAGSGAHAAVVRYWRGFALWRRAINGFNDKVSPAELQQDLKQALEEFNVAFEKDPAFVDARIGALSCAGFLGYSIYQQDHADPRIKDLFARTAQLKKDVEAAEPENPRFLWVIGPMIWNASPERGGGQAKAVELYQKGLEAIRNHKSASPTGPLAPVWGEPELLMSLAWTNLNQTQPDLNAAERYARDALKLVPYWHYVRDILLPQIQKQNLKTAWPQPKAKP